MALRRIYGRKVYAKKNKGTTHSTQRINTRQSNLKYKTTNFGGFNPFERKSKRPTYTRRNRMWLKVKNGN
tara:strand:+ start:2310 stop:2519 length:210 start_codon:yes stop_codon:yes gene_type:complete